MPRKAEKGFEDYLTRELKSPDRGLLANELIVPGKWGVEVAVVSLWAVRKRGMVVGRFCLRVGPESAGVTLRSGSLIEGEDGVLFAAPPAQQQFRGSGSRWFKSWTIPRELARAIAEACRPILGL